MPTAQLIEEYVRGLDRRLAGPRRVKRDMLAEARDSLVDAAEAYQAAGMGPRQAQARAVADFGMPGPVAAAYQRELAAGAGRRLAAVVAAVHLLGVVLTDRMWQGSPWADGAGVHPGSGYVLLSRSLDALAYLAGAAAVLALLALRRQARRGSDPRGLCRGLALGTIATMSATAVLGSAVYVSTLRTWPVSGSWPPMTIGAAALVAVSAAQVAAAVRCLRTARAAADLTPAPAGWPRPETC